LRRALAAILCAAVLGAVGAAFAHAVVGRPAALVLPELHGQVSWPPGARPAPAGVPRGRVAVIALVARGCTECLAELRFTLNQLPTLLRPLVVRRVVRGHSVLLLIDQRGDVRTGYTFPFAPAFVEGDVTALSK
jgi:hypothetical protein